MRPAEPLLRSYGSQSRKYQRSNATCSASDSKMTVTGIYSPSCLKPKLYLSRTRGQLGRSTFRIWLSEIFRQGIIAEAEHEFRILPQRIRLKDLEKLLKEIRSGIDRTNTYSLVPLSVSLTRKY